MKFIQKHWLPILLAIAIIAAILLNLNTNEKRDSVDTEIAELTANSVAQCYLYEEEVNAGTDDEPYIGFNREFVEITITDTGLTTGQHFILPFEKDSNKANFIGIAEEEFINVAATANAEGETWQEQRVYKIVGNNLLVGYQEVFVPQYENEYGVYLYEDLNKIKFETEEFYLSKVDCGSVDRAQF